MPIVQSESFHIFLEHPTRKFNQQIWNVVKGLLKGYLYKLTQFDIGSDSIAEYFVAFPKILADLLLYPTKRYFYLRKQQAYIFTLIRVSEAIIGLPN